MTVHIVSKTALLDFARVHPPAMGPLLAWHTAVSRASWTCFADVRRTYNSADLASGETVVFNVNSNRVVANIAYNPAGMSWLYIQHVFTHPEYDAWNKAK